MVLSFALLIAGFVLLVKGADFFVDGSSSIAKLLKIPSIVIGLTIVAFGTSAPEAAVSIIAGIEKSNDIAVGNVIGSNMFNLLVVLGVSAAIKPVQIKGQIIAKEYPFMLIATALLMVMSYDAVLGGGSSNVITRGDAIILLLFMGIFLFSVLGSPQPQGKHRKRRGRYSLLRSRKKPAVYNRRSCGYNYRRSGRC